MRYLIFYTLFNLVTVVGALGDTQTAVSSFVENIVNGRSILFLNKGIVHRGFIIDDYKIIEIREEKNKVTVHVEYHVIGSFRANEQSPLPIKHFYSKARKKRVFYEFLKDNRTYRLRKTSLLVPYVLNSRL